MFDNLKMMGAVAGLMRDKERVAEAAERVRTRADAVRAEGSAGAGAVRVTANALMRITDVSLSPALSSAMSDDTSRAHAEALVSEATNDALERAIQQLQIIVAEEAEALGIPGLAPQLQQQLGGFLGRPTA